MSERSDSPASALGRAAKVLTSADELRPVGGSCSGSRLRGRWLGQPQRESGVDYAARDENASEPCSKTAMDCKLLQEWLQRTGIFLGRWLGLSVHGRVLHRRRVRLIVNE